MIKTGTREVDGSAAGARPAIRGLVGLAVFVALHLALFWSVTYLPTQDGPVHRYNASLQGGALAAPASTTLREYYELRPATLANAFAQQMLAMLMAATSPESGERLFASLYLLLFAGASWYLVVGTRPDNGALLVLWVPFALTYLFHMGFYAFCFGVATSLVLVGYWTRHRQRFGPGHAGLAASVGLLVVLWHPFAFVVVVLVLAIAVVGSAAVRVARGSPWPRELRDGVTWPLLSLVPGSAVLMASAPGQGSASTHLLQRPWEVLRQLRHPPLWVSFDDHEWIPWGVLILVVSVVVAALVIRKVQRSEWHDLDPLLLAAATLGALFLLGPDTMPDGGGLIHARLIWCFGLVVLWWLASQPLAPPIRSALLGTGVLCGLVLLGMHARSYTRSDSLLTEYASALAAVPPHASLLGLSTADRGDTPDLRIDPRVLPMLHADALVGTDTDVALVANYQANRPFFPVSFRKGRNPLGDKYNHERFPFQAVDLDQYEGPSGRRIDAIVIWGPAASGRGQRGYDATLAQIAQRYTRTFVSAPRGLAQVWRRRSTAAP